MDTVVSSLSTKGTLCRNTAERRLSIDGGEEISRAVLLSLGCFGFAFAFGFSSSWVCFLEMLLLLLLLLLILAAVVELKGRHRHANKEASALHSCKTSLCCILA